MVHLPLRYHMNIRLLAIIAARVVTHDDGAVRTNDKCGAVGHADSRTTTRLRLDRIAGVKFCVAAEHDCFARGGADHADLTFERNESCTVGRFRSRAYVFPWITKLPNVKRGAAPPSAEDQEKNPEVAMACTTHLSKTTRGFLFILLHRFGRSPTKSFGQTLRGPQMQTSACYQKPGILPD